MGYQVLARKYRPGRFSEVVGQEAIIQTLKNALRFERVAYAYLFSGSRGIGKTTLARLFAKALNCAARQDDFEPCGSCASCQEIALGQSLDVLEIDGASNRGIDDIRQINETVSFMPSNGKFKIYLIDEVHMLTKEAFNALLKTLEEPPAHVKFFFATTEPHKILPTILSRCQRFDLGRLLPEQISAKLTSICQEIQRPIDPEAVDLLSRFADGSLRDAESLLDQILCFSEGTVTGKHVREALGLVPQELLFELDRAFAEGRMGFAFEAVETLFQSGKDLAHFLQQAVEHYRWIVVAKTSKVATPPGYKQAAEHYTQPQALAILDHLVRAEAQFSKSFSQRSALEIALLQLLRLKNRIPVEALIRRLSELEEKLSHRTAEIAPTPPPVQEDPPASPKKPIELVAVPFSPRLEPPKQPARIESPPPPRVEIPSSSPQKHPSHYDTLIRFAAVELEGTLKKE